MARRIRCFITIVLIFTFLFCPSRTEARKRKKYYVSCRSAALFDSTRGKRLYGRKVTRKILPASTAKVMTALLVLEKLSLDDYVTVGPRAARVQPSRLGLKVGEQYTVGDLLYATIIKSANDASIVLAEAVAGSEWKFVQMMNQRARELGAHNTKFSNSNGLPSKKGSQYTTAYDMYLIFREALKQRFFRSAIRLKYKTIFSKDGRKFFLKSHNKILFFKWRQKIYGKTGYTRAAGPCFVGTTPHKERTLIISAFGCSRRWQDIKYIISHYGGVGL